MKSNLKLTLQTSIATLVMLIALPVFAQDRNEGPAIVTKEKDFDTSSRELRRISEKRDAEKAPAPTPADLLAQARGDFMTIQMINKNMKLAATDQKPLDLKFVLDSASELRMRAEDLDTILPLPKRDKDAERLKPVASVTQDELKGAILDLSSRIREFIMNPSFREPTLEDNEQTRKARLGLENIIEISKQLQKDTEKLQKANSEQKP